MDERSLGSSHHSQASPILRLPLELRRIIYRHTLLHSLEDFRVPHELVQAVYYEKLRDVWVDRPSSLLFLNKQIFFEVSDLMKWAPVALRITGQGMVFGCEGLTACIAQDIRGDLSKITHLFVEIWPPHPDRPVEMLYIWGHLRKLRDVLAACGRMQKISLRFRDNMLFTWAVNGHLHRMLPSRHHPNGFRDGVQHAEESDLKALLDLFACGVASVKHVVTVFPASYPRSFLNDYLREHAETVMEIMKGVRPPVKRLSIVENLEWEGLEKDLKRYEGYGWIFQELVSRGSSLR